MMILYKSLIYNLPGFFLPPFQGPFCDMNSPRNSIPSPKDKATRLGGASVGSYVASSLIDKTRALAVVSPSSHLPSAAEAGNGGWLNGWFTGTLKKNEDFSLGDKWINIDLVSYILGYLQCDH